MVSNTDTGTEQTAKQLMKNTKAQLVEMANSRQLEVKGTKADIVERIMDYVAKASDNLASCTKSDLVEIGRAFGVDLTMSWKKADMIKAVEKAVDQENETEMAADEPDAPDEPEDEIIREQISSLGRRHFQIRAPKWCPTCGRSNNWKPIDLRSGNSTHERLCDACGILWATEVDHIEESDGQREIIFRDEVIAVEVGEYSHRADFNLPPDTNLDVGLVVFTKSIVLDRTVRDAVKSTSTCKYGVA